MINLGVGVLIMGIMYGVVASKKSSGVTLPGRELIKKFEGLSLTRYRDAGGLWTIGYGHLIKPNESIPNRITKAQAEVLFKNDLFEIAEGVRGMLKVGVSNDQFNALISLAFNIGVSALRDSTLMKYLNGGDYGSAADQFLSWRFVDKVLNMGLFRRRQQEREIFLRGT